MTFLIVALWSIIGMAAGMVILGERVTAWRLIGCLILIAGVVLLGSASA